jgi:hypothetical protein
VKLTLESGPQVRLERQLDQVVEAARGPGKTFGFYLGAMQRLRIQWAGHMHTLCICVYVREKERERERERTRFVLGKCVSGCRIGHQLEQGGEDKRTSGEPFRGFWKIPARGDGWHLVQGSAT